MVSKKPKPIGMGNFRVCPQCQGTGVKTITRRYPKSPTGDAEVLEDCKTCKTGGWIRA